MTRDRSSAGPPVHRLVLDLGDRTERHVLAGSWRVLGSAPESDLVARHPTVSRRHARLRITRHAVEVEDLGSRNGTTVAGQRVKGRAYAEAGDPVAFGSLAGRIERVEAGDLEVAVPLAGPEPAPAPDKDKAEEVTLQALQAGGPVTTASLGSLRPLVLEALPGIVERVAEQEAPLRIAQAVGAALFEHLPCLRVEIREAEGDGLLFTADRGARPETAVTVQADAGGHVLAVDFAHPTQARGFEPLIAAFARVIGAGSRRRPGRREPAGERPAPPPLPHPETVVPAVRKVYRDAARVAAGDVSVLILGESGTGKEVLARYLHAASHRAGGPFVDLNCAALPRDLLEAELFGIEERVATGVASRPGKFEAADGGTLFLDEIGDMAPETQAKILRTLQEGEVYRLGGDRPRPARVRTLAATNRDLDAMIEAGTFRNDLYHRIADWRVTLPPLRRRRADTPNLAACFLAEEAERRGIAVTGITRAALDHLTAYAWPGNVRQLQREMARAVLFLEDGQALESSHLDASIREGGDGGEPAGTLHETLARTERREILRALEAHDGDVTAAAAELGIGRSTLYRRMSELGIER
jgi:DNA-binding NtrC family response regulator